MTGMEMFLLSGVLTSVSGQFFHEPSGVTLKPSEGPATSDFGFSIAYQDSPPRLVVGAPREDFVGKVYSCPLSDLSSINCSVIDMTSLQIEEKTAAARKLKNPDGNYFFGSSIVATSNYFLTCAPLLIKQISKKVVDTFGGCYVNNYTTFNNTYSEWIDSAARFGDKLKTEEKRIYPHPISFNNVGSINGGGLGWNTFVDDSFLIAAKSGYKTDILYTNAEHPLDLPSQSLLDERKTSIRRRYFRDYFNMGYGLAVGNFFDKSEKLYAVSLRTDLNGSIFFLQKKYGDYGRGHYLEMMEESEDSLAYIEDYSLSSMFGYAMAAADVNRDGLSELLVGAPAQTDDGRRELGALHIYVGGDLHSRNDKRRMRTVLANKEDGRFGSAIATSDIDGDSLPEIFVSAPYEDSGVVYALSGYELKQMFFSEDGYKLARLTDLKLTQNLRGDGGSKLFGFSLLMVKDVDKNGCDELAIGSPDSSLVKLVRCLPAVNTSLTLELLGDPIVEVNAKTFTVQVCLNVTINKKCQSVSGNISVESITTGNTKITDPMFTYHITTSDEELPFCKNIKVDLTKDAEQTDYTFTTKLKIEDDFNSSVYNSWAVLSAYSETEKSLTVRRLCTRADCEPDLSYKTLWSGNDFIGFTKSEAMEETLTFEITNANANASSVVLELMVRGALVRSGECEINKNIISINDTKAYSCSLPKMLKKGDSYNLTVPVYLPAPTNILNLDISAKLYDTVFPNKTFEGESLVIPFKIEAGDVTVKGSRNSFNVTDKDLKDGILFVESSSIHQEFIISNTGPVTWHGLLAVLQIKSEYVQHVTVVTRSENEKWVQQYDPNDSGKIIFNNRMTLRPKSDKIIEVSLRLSKDKLESDISNGDLTIISDLTFDLDPLTDTRKEQSSTQIIYNKILTVGNNKWLIILIVVILAVLLLLILMFVLYKHGFFKRAEKKKLSVLRESIRRRSVRLASENSRSVRGSVAVSENSRGQRPSIANGVHCDMEVVDDSAFDEVDIAPTTSRSDHSLIETSPKDNS